MKARAYLLLDIVNKDTTHLLDILRESPGVVSVDRLEGNPDIIVFMEACDRKTLAEMMMPVIKSIENITEDLRLLISRDNELSGIRVNA